MVGGGSGMGRALAAALYADGAEVTIAGRTPARLDAVARELPGVRTVTADVTRESDVERMVAAAGELDHVVVTAVDATGVYRPVADLDVAEAGRVLATKLIGPLLLARHAAPVLAGGGSLTFTSGINAYRPAPGGAVVSAANGGLASLAAALAVELAPLRVNVVSPGWVDTPVWDAIAGAGKDARLAAMAARLPVGRIGRPEDIARAFLAVMRNPFITGTVLHADGGHRLV